ncbi:MAG TPA: hypothetical protein VN826_17860 [Candidatus Eisenbacteria bacterium]|jgi:hypothetical protein|nr:hypothetical protein [Candidatus Eisenbacteria bacterium]
MALDVAMDESEVEVVMPANAGIQFVSVQFKNRIVFRLPLE